MKISIAGDFMKNLTVVFFNIVDVIFIVAVAVAGVAGIIFATSSDSISMEKKLSGIIGLLSGLLLVVGYERLKHWRGLETKVDKLSKDFEKLKEDLLAIPSYEVIYNDENITQDTLEEVKTAVGVIRATNFKNSTDSTDTPPKYYETLGHQMKQHGGVYYRCCFNEHVSLEKRKEGFINAGLTEKEYRRMEYYKFKDQHYFNFLIFDEKIVFIGFPKSSQDQHMQVALKIKAEKSQVAADFIKDLARWYDEVLKTTGTRVNTKDLLGY